MSSRPLFATTALAVALAAAVLGGCADSMPPPASAAKPVKIEVAGATAAGTIGSFVGTLRARQRAELGFEAPGRLAAVLVDVGDRVRKGQVLARLDEAPARWRLTRAEADRAAAEAAFKERSNQLRQQEGLAKDGIISPAALESAQAAHRQAASQLESADAAVAAARRDLALTSITAPFDGEIVARQSQPHADVAPGQAVLQLEAGQALEVVALLPEAATATLAPGQAAVGSSGNQTVALTLERLSERSENGSLRQAVFRVNGATSGLHSGGVLSVEWAGKAAPAVTLPMAALMPSATAGRGSVYVLDAEQGELHRREVRTASEILPGGRVRIEDGLRTGELVVVAGTAFLTDGQKAVVHAPQTVLGGTAR
jgi:RND family efflux transporter MFP subunit